MAEKLPSLASLKSDCEHIDGGPESRGKLLSACYDFLSTFYNTMDNRKAYRDSKQICTDLLKIDGGATEFEELLTVVNEQVVEHGELCCSGGHLGYVPASGNISSALADCLAAAINPQSAVAAASPGAVEMENQVLRWIMDVVGFDSKTSSGNLTSGSSMASLIAFVAARENFLKSHKDVQMQDMTVYTSEQVHLCIHKALHVIGLGKVIIQRVTVNPEFSMDIDELTKLVAADRAKGKIPFLVVGTAGTTNTGSIDALNRIANIAEENDMWFHVDAAYGGFFMLCSEMQYKLAGLEKADSIAMDLHKSLFISFGTGAVLIKDGKLHRDAFTLQTHNTYMQDQEDQDQVVSPCQLSPELSRHFRGLRVWMPLKMLGIKPFQSALREKVMLANLAYEELSKIEGMQVGPKPQLSIVLFRYVGSPVMGDQQCIRGINQRIHQYILNNGEIFLSSTMIAGNFWLRLAVLNHRTHLEHIRKALKVIQRAISSLA